MSNSLTIATWNVNSVRLRIDTILSFLADTKPDVLCLQETKCPDEFFPLDEFKKAGYTHYFYTGMKSYNGVAVISKLPLSDTGIVNHCQKEDCRHIYATIGDLFELHNVYIPAGGPDPDPVLNPSFKHKLDFVDSLKTWFSANRQPKHKMVLVGDLNIAPLENDVWSHKQLLNVVSHTPVEVEKFTAFYDALPWADAMRHFVNPSEKLYTWWSYRNKDWKKSNRGRRLDHIWVSKPLEKKLESIQVYSAERDKERPSDHVPVTLSIFQKN